MGCRTAWWLLATLILALPAMAQPSPEQGGVSVTIEETSGTVSVEAPSRFTVVVKNLAQATGTPLDQPVQVTFALAGVPEEWTASISPATVRLMPQEEKVVTLQVSVSTGASEEAATITVTGRSEGSGAPVVGEAASDDVQIKIGREEGPTRSVLEAIGDWIWIVLLALLAALMVSTKLVVDRRRVPVRIWSDHPEVKVSPGSTVEVPLHVQNLTRSRDSITLYAAPPEDGWRVVPRTPEVTLDRGSHATIPVRIEVPEGARPGSHQRIMVTASSVQTPGKQAIVTVRVTVA